MSPTARWILGDVAGAIRADNVHYPRTRLVAVENTHNLCSGTPLTPDYMHALGSLAREHGLRVHVDGARLFNAAVALSVDVKSLTVDANSVTFCLSKGLAAPVGSLVCGDRDFVAEARRARKIVGGGMRQAGVLAAAGIVALERMVDRLAEDHANARALAAAWPRFPASGSTKSPCAPTSFTSRSRGLRWMRRAWWPGWRNPVCAWGRWAGAAYVPC